MAKLSDDVSPMKRFITLVALLVLGIGIAVANTPRPRTLDQKVKEADLIVLGTATAFGPKRVVSGDWLYERDLRVEVKAVLWPPSYRNINAIVFRYYIVTTWPKSWWDYTKTPGIFFLTKNKRPERGQWDMLEGLGGDWMEHATNAPAVRALVKKLKK